MLAATEDETLGFSHVRRKLKAMFIGSIGNLIEWYDREAWFSYYLTLVIAVALLVSLAMHDTKLHSAIGRHE